MKENLEKLLNKHEKIRKIYVSFLINLLPNRERLPMIYMFNTAGYILSLYLYYLITGEINSGFLLSSTLNYSIFTIIPTLYAKYERFRNYIRRFIYLP
mgnify:FL=1